jgi:hypothetical protein
MCADDCASNCNCNCNFKSILRKDEQGVLDCDGVLLSETKQKLLSLSEKDAERLVNLMNSIEMIEKRIKEFDKEQ